MGAGQRDGSALWCQNSDGHLRGGLWTLSPGLPAECELTLLPGPPPQVHRRPVAAPAKPPARPPPPHTQGSTLPRKSWGSCSVTPQLKHLLCRRTDQVRPTNLRPQKGKGWPLFHTRNTYCASRLTRALRQAWRRQNETEKQSLSQRLGMWRGPSAGEQGGPQGAAWLSRAWNAAAKGGGSVAQRGGGNQNDVHMFQEGQSRPQRGCAGGSAVATRPGPHACRALSAGHVAGPAPASQTNVQRAGTRLGHVPAVPLWSLRCVSCAATGKSGGRA